MQLMPVSSLEMRARLSLGSNPDDPREFRCGHAIPPVDVFAGTARSGSGNLRMV